MSLGGLLKSSSTTTLAGAAGTGAVGSGVGVGGWQLYEQVINPTLDKQLSRDKYSKSQIAVPLESIPANNTFQRSSWGCVKQLFPNVNIGHGDEEAAHTSKISTSSMLLLNKYTALNHPKPSFILTTPKPNYDFVICSLMDLREGSEASQNKIYFKSETAARGKDYGWIMWSNVASPNTGTKRLHEYRLLLLKKEQNTWSIDKKFIWNKSELSDYEVEQNEPFTLSDASVPDDTPWKSEAQSGDSRYSTRKTWAGFGVVDKGKVKWMSCEPWAADRKSQTNLSYIDEGIRDLCYSKPTTPSA